MMMVGRNGEIGGVRKILLVVHGSSFILFSSHPSIVFCYNNKPSAMQTKKIYKFNFTAQVQTVTLALKFPCFVAVSWRRGQKQVLVKNRREIINGVVTFNEPLQLECNMTFDAATKKFQDKLTRFTVLIYSQKGNKQAGEVNFDVSEFLNAKQKEMKIERTLEKCPDKNAKLSFVLSGYAKQEVQKDNVSQKSYNTIDPTVLVNPSAILQPDFKKKKPQQPPLPQKQQKRQEKTNQENIEQRVPMVSKQSKQRLKLQEENRRLKEQMAELRELQIENTTLRQRYDQAQKKSLSYYTKKLQQLKKEVGEYKMKAKTVEQLQQKKYDLQKEMCDCKEQMGRILNFAITSGNNEMAEEIYNIYQNSKPTP